MARFAEYYRLTKPGIVYGNALSAIAAFLYGARWEPWQFGGWGSAAALFSAMLFGISLVIASACVYNNYIDRDIDRKMERTRIRALVTGTIPVRSALIFGTALGLIGLAILLSFVNALTAAIALFGWLSYVLIYGWAKRRGWWGALVGSVPGAVPIVVGYVAVAGRFAPPAFLLFLTMVAWQMPHFYAIAMFRRKDYLAAGIPTLANVKGMHAAKLQAFFFICIFLLFSPLLFVFDYAGYAYGVIMLALSLAWLWRAVRSDKSKNDIEWGRSIFLFSLLVLLGFCLALAASPLLP